MREEQITSLLRLQTDTETTNEEATKGTPGNQELTCQERRKTPTWENRWRLIDSILKKKNEGETTSSASPVGNQDTSLQNTSKEDRRTNKGTTEKNRDHRTLERNENSKDINMEDDNREAKFELSSRTTG